MHAPKEAHDQTEREVESITLLIKEARKAIAAVQDVQAEVHTLAAKVDHTVNKIGKAGALSAGESYQHDASTEDLPVDASKDAMVCDVVC